MCFATKSSIADSLVWNDFSFSGTLNYHVMHRYIEHRLRRKSTPIRSRKLCSFPKSRPRRCTQSKYKNRNPKTLGKPHTDLNDVLNALTTFSSTRYSKLLVIIVRY